MYSGSVHYINMDEYFQSSVLIPFIVHNGEYYIVLEKRSAHIRQGGDICFPGGKFDAKVDQNTKDTAIRETCEELGIKSTQIHTVNYWGTYIAPMYTLIDTYTGFIDIEDMNQFCINKAEVEKLIILPFSHFVNQTPLVYEIDSWSYPYRKSTRKEKSIIFPAKELGLPSKYHAPWKGKERKIYVYSTGDVPVWGVTANIIRKLVAKHNSNEVII